MESPSIFLSHAHEDNRFARKLAGALSQRGALVWVDECELRLGDSVIDCVAKAIADGDFLLAIISPASLRSEWCRYELNLAATRGIEDKRVVVLPIRLGGVRMPSTLADRYRADGDETGVAALADRIVRDVDRHRGIEPSSADVAWLRSALAAFDLESETARERWVFHLKAATRSGRASVRVDGSTHHLAADRLARMGALETLRSSGSWVFYGISERGRGLLTAIRARERAPSVETGP